MGQIALRLPRRGGKRPGAGRKPKGRRALVSHHRRPRFEKPAAVQVTLSVGGQVWNLRSRRCFETIEACLVAARERFGLRVIEFTVLGNAAHHYGEAGHDRFSSRAYTAPRRQEILSRPRSWLLRSGWRRARTVPQWLTANAWPPPWVQQHPLPPRQNS